MGRIATHSWPNSTVILPRLPLPPEADFFRSASCSSIASLINLTSTCRGTQYPVIAWAGLAVRAESQGRGASGSAGTTRMRSESMLALGTPCASSSDCKRGNFRVSDMPRAFTLYTKALVGSYFALDAEPAVVSISVTSYIWGALARVRAVARPTGPPPTTTADLCCVFLEGTGTAAEAPSTAETNARGCPPRWLSRERRAPALRKVGLKATAGPSKARTASVSAGLVRSLCIALGVPATPAAAGRLGD